MTRYKRKKTAVILKLIGLVTAPVSAALCVAGIPHIMSAAERIGNLKLSRPSVAVSREQPVYNVRSDKPDRYSVLSSEAILSEGYGIQAETYRKAAKVRLLSPLKMVSDFPGEKPYPSEWSDGGDIIRTTYGEYSGTTFFNLEKYGQVSNKTDIPNDTLYEASRCLPAFTISDTDAPQVLIYHTHTTESFEPFVRDHYDSGFNYRTTDETKNVVMVGDALQAELEAQGINVIHVRTIHDYPSYNGSYGRSRETIVPILEQYPSIKVALDIHRDAIAGEGTAYQPYVDIDGREAAQIMIISGCDDGTMDMPDYMKNFRFACCLQQQIEGDFPGLTRPILFDYRHYNQDLTTGSLLIEIGSHGSTLEQVQYAGQLVGRSLGELLCSIKEK